MKVLLIVLLVSLSACTSPSKTSTKDAQELVDAVTYVKSKQYNVCYGVATVSRIGTDGHLAYNNLFTTVDCAKVNL